MRLETRHLQLVHAIVEEGTMTRASERLHLSQPALSQQLRDLEERLGTRVFDRDGRRLVLTPAGARVLDAARAVFEELERAEADVAALASGRAGTLRLATQCYTTYHWLPGLLRTYQQAYPDVDVQIRVEATTDPEQYLLDGALDVAIVTRFNHPDNLVRVELIEDEMVAIVPDDHAWTSLPYVSPEAFAPVHLLVYQACLTDNDLYTRVLRPAGIEPARVTPLPASSEAAVEMVRAGMGVTVMASWAAQPYLDRGGLAAVRITPDGFHRTWYAARRPGPAPRFVTAFVDALQRLEIRQGASPLACEVVMA